MLAGARLASTDTDAVTEAAAAAAGGVPAIPVNQPPHELLQRDATEADGVYPLVSTKLSLSFYG